MKETDNTKGLVLVTGGTGFLGAHCILQLMQKGYRVRTTIRTITKKNQVIEMLKTGGITNPERLEFVEADLTTDLNWDAAVAGCEFVLHVASPIFIRIPEHEDEMIRPAVDGTVRVLRAATKAGVKRVVMTSNFGAVGYSHKDKNVLITETSWTNPDEKGLSPYNRSKIFAERAAWDFISTSGTKTELTVINPVAIFGPSLDKGMSSAFELLRNVMNGTMKALPDISLGIVDVRDVAGLHILAMTEHTAAGERFLCLSGGTMTLLEISKFLKKELPAYTSKASTRRAPGWVMKLMALFNPRAKALLPLIGIYRNASNEKARKLLGWKPVSNQEAVLATANSLIHYGNIISL